MIIITNEYYSYSHPVAMAATLKFELFICLQTAKEKSRTIEAHYSIYSTFRAKNRKF